MKGLGRKVFAPMLSLPPTLLGGGLEIPKAGHLRHPARQGA